MRDILGIVDGIVHLTDAPSIAILSVREVDCIATNRLTMFSSRVLGEEFLLLLPSSFFSRFCTILLHRTEISIVVYLVLLLF